ncbi:MAG: tRNA (guanosine(46)-N7)-methyltransferase TrmB [Bacillota bacterium]
MRLRKKPGVQNKLQEMRELVIPNPEVNKGNWHAVFGNTNPLHVELGTGKGTFITTLAGINPEINYLGVEKVPDILYIAAKKAIAQCLPNLRFLHMDVENLPFIFEDGEVDRIYLNFSDPWPKKRHSKRRLTHRHFLEIYKKVLKKPGEIHLKTDNQGFFEFSLNEFSEMGFRLRNITFDLHNSGFSGNVMTEYEERFVNLGQPIYRCEAIVLPE